MTQQEKHAYIEKHYSKLADNMWVAIDGQVPFDQWIPLVKDKEVATEIICMFINLDCYGQNFELVFNNGMTAFMKIKREGWSGRALYPKKAKEDVAECKGNCSIEARDK